MTQKPLTLEDLVQDFHRLGVPGGGLVMVHSSLSSIGHVDGGAETVVDALLEALGPTGPRARWWSPLSPMKPRESRGLSSIL